MSLLGSDTEVKFRAEEKPLVSDWESGGLEPCGDRRFPGGITPTSQETTTAAALLQIREQEQVPFPLHPQREQHGSPEL
jgi:hypothetical protein